MGFFDALFGNKNQIPTVTSILPAAAKNEIMSGRLPILNTDQLFLKRGEKMILSRLVDTFSSRILYPMLLLSGNHNIAVV